jgi:hypothetical protein
MLEVAVSNPGGFHDSNPGIFRAAAFTSELLAESVAFLSSDISTVASERQDSQLLERQLASQHERGEFELAELS